MDKVEWGRKWSNPAFSPIWWVDGPHALIRKHVESGWLSTARSVLEIGCGAGQQAAWLNRLGFDVLAFDFSAEAIARAQKEHPPNDKLKFVIADATATGEITGTFDAIVDGGCLHTINRSQHHRYRDNIVSWSHAGSRYLLMLHCDHLARWHDHLHALFSSQFELTSWEQRAGCLPLMPMMPMAVFCLERKQH